MYKDFMAPIMMQSLLLQKQDTVAILRRYYELFAVPKKKELDSGVSYDNINQELRQTIELYWIQSGVPKSRIRIRFADKSNGRWSTKHTNMTKYTTI